MTARYLDEDKCDHPPILIRRAKVKLLLEKDWPNIGYRKQRDAGETPEKPYQHDIVPA